VEYQNDVKIKKMRSVLSCPEDFVCLLHGISVLSTEMLQEMKLQRKQNFGEYNDSILA
jgi:hypothetical protein